MGLGLGGGWDGLGWAVEVPVRLVSGLTWRSIVGGGGERERDRQRETEKEGGESSGCVKEA